MAHGGGRSGSLRRALRPEEKPTVCFDEMPYQMVAEKRTPIPARPGSPERYDYEYERTGMRKTCSCSSSRRLLGATSMSRSGVRPAVDFAQQMRNLADEHYYPEAERIRVVLDNLNTHTPAALLYEAFENHERPSASSGT